MNLQEKLRKRRFVITAELTPPVSAERDELLAKAAPLKGLADAVNITDGAGARPHLAAMTAAAMLVEAGLEPILQITCRDRNRIALQSDLIGAAASGIRNLLMIRGDDPSTGDQPEAKAVFDIDPRALLETARRLRDTGDLPSGRKVGGRTDFFLGAADNPIDPPSGWRPDKLAAKLTAGAQFVQTQFCMDAGLMRRYMARLDEAGLTDKLSLIVGIVPLRSVKSANWIRDKLFGAVIPDAIDCTARARERSGRRRPPHLSGDGAAIIGDSACVRRAHHGARQRRRGAGHHCRRSRQCVAARRSVNRQKSISKIYKPPVKRSTV